MISAAADSVFKIPISKIQCTVRKLMMPQGWVKSFPNSFLEKHVKQPQGSKHVLIIYGISDSALGTGDVPATKADQNQKQISVLRELVF